MDLSALIFVALAVAWVAYLVPKALRHHEEDAVSRSVDGFSDRMRVLARREPVSATEAALVPTGRTAPLADVQPEPEVEVEPEPEVEIDETPAASTPAPRTTRPRSAAARAAARRRRVFTLLVLAIAVVSGLAIGAVIAPAWVAAPVVLMAAWLVACRLMVKRERAARAAATPIRKRRRTLADEVIAAEDLAVAADDDTGEIPVITDEILDEPAPVDPDAWTPVPVPLPTYVAKAPAGRSVRTIDLDSTGVWSSGRNEADSQLAREAEAQRAKPEATDAEQRRAAGS